MMCWVRWRCSSWAMDFPSISQSWGGKPNQSDSPEVFILKYFHVMKSMICSKDIGGLSHVPYCMLSILRKGVISNPRTGDNSNPK
jgi:hypothetical protein